MLAGIFGENLHERLWKLRKLCFNIPLAMVSEHGRKRESSTGNGNARAFAPMSDNNRCGASSFAVAECSNRTGQVVYGPNNRDRFRDEAAD